MASPISTPSPRKSPALQPKPATLPRTSKQPIDTLKARPILEQIASKWTVLILTRLCAGPLRFNELMRRLDGITHKALADALKRLERNGLVTREVLATMPVGVEYAITPLGHSLRKPFLALYEWALAFGDDMERAQRAFDRSHPSA